ncbi:MAG: immunoglobulin-like domain-containing protein [Dorea sp.]
MKKNTWKRKVLSILLVFVLMFANIGMVQAEGRENLDTTELEVQSTEVQTIATEEQSTETEIQSTETEEQSIETEVQPTEETAKKKEKTDPVKETGYGMTVKLQIEGYGYTVETEKTIKMPDTYKTFADYGLTGFTEPEEKGYTILHALAEYCEQEYGKESVAEMIQGSGTWVSGFLGMPEKSALMFLLNRQSISKAATEQKISENDLISVVDIWASNDWSMGTQYAWFTEEHIETAAEDAFTVQLNTTALMWGENSRLRGAEIQVLDSAENVVTSSVTDAEGKAVLTVDTAGTYTITAERFSEYYDDAGVHPHDITRPHATLIVSAAQPVTDEEAVEIAKEVLSLGDTSNVKEDLTLPLTGQKKTEIEWRSDNKEVLSDDGKVTRPVGENATVTLTAVISKGEATAEKTFHVTVAGYSLKLKSLEIAEGAMNFDPDQTSYIVYVPTNTQKITLTAQSEEVFPDMFVFIDGNLNLGEAKIIDFPETQDSLAVTIEVKKYFNAEKKSTTQVLIKRAANPGESLPDLSDVTWGQHLGNKDNNAVTDAQTPTEKGELLWESFSNAPDFWGSRYAGTPILVNNNIYAVRNHKIEMLDAKSGEVKASTELKEKVGFYSNIIYGGGMIFVPLGDGTIQAFHAATLESMFITQKPGGFGKSYYIYGAMHYADGILYVGFSDGDFVSPTGYYAAYDTVDTDVANDLEVITPLWVTDNDESYYGSGAVTIGDYVVVAGDKGIVSVRDIANGKEVSSCQLNGMVRGSLAYANGYVWAATKNAMLYKISINENGNAEIEAEAELPNGTNSTPVVTGGKVFVTGGTFDAGGYLAVYDVDLKKLAVEKTENNINTATVTTAYDDIYVYFSENGPEGSLYVAKVTANNKITIEKLYTPEHAQYSMSKIIVGADGTLYYGNDAGYLYAVKAVEKEEPVEPENPGDSEETGNSDKEDSENTDSGKEKKDTVKLEPAKRKMTVIATTVSEEDDITESQKIAQVIVKASKKGENMIQVNNPPEILEKEVFETLANYPDFKLILNCGKYTLSMMGSDVINTDAQLNTRLIELESMLSEEETAVYGNYQMLALIQEGKFPGKVTVVYELPEQFAASTQLYMYGFPVESDAVKVLLQSPYGMFTLEKAGIFILSDVNTGESESAEVTMQMSEELIPEESEKEENNPMPWIWILVALATGILVGSIVTRRVFMLRKKEDTWEK